MSQISKSICENTCRRTVFEMLGLADNENFGVISNSAYATVVVDDNGEEREVELRAIVRKVNEGMSGREMFENEVAAYAKQIEEKRAKKEEKEKEKAEKTAKDKAKREAAKAKKEAEEDE